MEKFDLTGHRIRSRGIHIGNKSRADGNESRRIERDKPGGVCLNWGCIPSKAILKCAEMYSHFLDSKSYGITHKGLSFDYSEVIKKSRKASTSLNRGVEGLFKKNKITLISGTGRLTSKHGISVIGKESQDIESERILLATGSVPGRFPASRSTGKW